MRTQMNIERLRPLIIGHAADNLTGIVEIDCSAWMTAYPKLTRYTLAVTLPGGGPYFAPTEMEGAILRWIVRREDTACAGEGSYQIIGTGENGEQKSTDFYPLYIYRNMPGLDGADGTPPDAALAWVSKVLNAADRAEDAAERAEGAAAGSVPVAKPDRLGVVKPGEGLEVEEDGTLNVVGGGAGGAVESVNGKTGAVKLTAADVGAADAKETAQAFNALSEEIANLTGKYELIDTISVEEDIKTFVVDKEPDGKNYNFKAVHIVAEILPALQKANLNLGIWVRDTKVGGYVSGAVDTVEKYWNAFVFPMYGKIFAITTNSVTEQNALPGSIQAFSHLTYNVSENPITGIEFHANGSTAVWPAGSIMKIYGVRIDE